MKSPDESHREHPEGSVEHNPRPANAVARWRQRFVDACDGLAIGIRTQESLHVHLVITLFTLIMAWLLAFDAWRWCSLLTCITLVISLELMNSAIERLVKTLHPAHDQGLAETLHLAASAVLAGSIGSIGIGVIIFLPPIWQFLSHQFG